MRKFYKYILVLSFFMIIFGLTSCKQYKDDLKAYLQFWATGAMVTGVAISDDEGTDKNGFRCMGSQGNSSEKKIEFILKNTQNFKLKTSDVLSFNSSLSPAPKFTLAQSSDSKKLTLTFTNFDELKKYERGEKDLSLTLKLIAEDGRKFTPYTFKLKINTKPPTPEDIIIAKTKNSDTNGDKYFVLCIPFKNSDMNIDAGSKKLHEDINKVYIDNKEIQINYEQLKKNTTNPASGCLKANEVDKLNSDLPTVDYVVYYKTGITVGDDLPEYAIKIIDQKGMESETKKSSHLDATNCNWYVSNSGDDGDSGGQDDPFKSLQKAIDMCTNSGNLYFINIITSLQNTSTNIFAGGKINTGNITINGNGNTLDAKQNGRVLEISNNANVTLKDITITGGLETNTSGGGILISGASSVLNIEDGVSITKNQSYEQGGGICVTAGSVIMKANSKITENESTGCSGGVFMTGGEFTMEDGTIENNTAEDEVSEIEISGKDSNSPKFIMKKGSIIGSAGTQFGSVMIGKEASFTMEDGAIISNSTSLHISENGKFTMTGGKVTTSSSYADDSSISLTGTANCEISGRGNVIGNIGSSISLAPSSSISLILDDKIYIQKPIKMKNNSSNYPKITPGADLENDIEIIPELYPSTVNTVKVLDGSYITTKCAKFKVVPETDGTKWKVNKEGKLVSNKSLEGYSIEDIALEENNMSEDSIPDRSDLKGNLIFYKTSEGRYGLMQVTDCTADASGFYSLKFNFKTFETDGNVYKEFNDVTVGNTGTYDLDLGVIAGPGVDFHLNTGSLNNQTFKPENNAKFYFWE